MNYWRNPPPALREREAARFPDWLARLALALPRLVLLDALAEAIGPDTWRVRLDVANAGYLSAAVTQRALERKQVRGVLFEIALPPGASLLGGAPRIEGPQLEGHAVKSMQQSFVPQREPLADRARGEWLLQAPAGTELQLSARAPRAGTVRATLRLGATLPG